MKKLMAVLITCLILVSACRKPEIIQLDDPLPSHETALVKWLYQENKTFTYVLDWMWEYKLILIAVILLSYADWMINSKPKPPKS
jgi:hypothetical protein